MTRRARTTTGATLAILTLIALSAGVLSGEAQGSPRLRACHVAQLSAQAVTGSFATGHAIAEISLTNQSRATCTLFGYPHLGMFDASGHPITTINKDLPPGYQSYFLNTPAERTVTLAEGTHAWFVVQYVDMGFGNVTCPTASRVSIRPPGRVRTLGLTGPGVAFQPFGLTKQQPCGLLELTPLVSKRILKPHSVAARSAPLRCQRKPGVTTYRHGSVRVFRRAFNVYGCVLGSTRRVWLGVAGSPEQANSIASVAGHFVAFQSVLNNQYTYAQNLQVVNLADGTGYSVASLSWPIGGSPEASPATPGPWPIEAFALNAGGLTARLYSTFAPGSGPSSQPDGQVLDVVGAHGYDQTLATTAAGAIAPGSLAYHGNTVSWTENGVAESADVPSLAQRRALGKQAEPSAATAWTKIVGGTTAERSLLGQIVADMAPTRYPYPPCPA
jgi:Protein of unknown function (DUF4232)